MFHVHACTIMFCLCFIRARSVSHRMLAQAKRGGLRNTDATDLMATVFKAVLDKTSVDPKVWKR